MIILNLNTFKLTKEPNKCNMKKYINVIHLLNKKKISKKKNIKY